MRLFESSRPLFGKIVIQKACHSGRPIKGGKKKTCQGMSRKNPEFSIEAYVTLYHFHPDHYSGSGTEEVILFWRQ